MTKTTVHMSSIHASSIWAEMLDCPEVRGALSVANAEEMTMQEGMEMALLALFAQNKRLREGLIAISKEINDVKRLYGGMP